MTSGLRKVHKYIWISIALILPVFMFLSIQKDPNTLIENSKKVRVFPASFNEVNEFVSYQKKGNQLTIVVKKSLKSASTAVYELKNSEERVFLGELASANQTYIYNVDSKINGFLLFDVIKKEVIYKIIF